jgi:hypothetical protein
VVRAGPASWLEVGGAVGASDAEVRHGTYSGYNRHLKVPEPACGACRQAATDYQRRRRLVQRLEQQRAEILAMILGVDVDDC